MTTLITLHIAGWLLCYWGVQIERAALWRPFLLLPAGIWLIAYASIS